MAFLFVSLNYTNGELKNKILFRDQATVDKWYKKENFPWNSEVVTEVGSFKK